MQLVANFFVNFAKVGEIPSESERISIEHSKITSQPGNSVGINFYSRSVRDVGGKSKN